VGTLAVPAILQWRPTVVRGAAMLWTAGFIVCLIRIGIEWRRARTLRQRDLDDAGEDVRAHVAELCVRLSVPRAVRVFRSSLASVPMVLGWQRPTILLPSLSMTGMGANQVSAVLAHELAHVKRRDYEANLFQIAADALLFFHPGARWVSRRIRIEREYWRRRAQEIASDAAGYARALAALEDGRSDCSLAVAAASGTLLDRIQRIVGQTRPQLTPAKGAVALVTASLLAAIVLGLVTIVPPSLPLTTNIRMRTPMRPGQTGQVPEGERVRACVSRRPTPVSPAKAFVDGWLSEQRLEERTIYCFSYTQRRCSLLDQRRSRPSSSPCASSRRQIPPRSGWS
jgi:D-alanyl-D-alanine endopeptidase (penicillin-binding protein 7)